MKFLTVLIVLMTSVNLMADDDCESCDKLSQSELVTTQKSAYQYEDEKLKKVIRKMCYELVGAVLEMQKDYEKFTPDYIITMGAARYFDVPEDASDIEELRQRFWNEHNHKMYCRTTLLKNTFNGRKSSHISKLMMRQNFGSSFHLAIYKYQKKVNPKSNYDIDHVEIIDGKKETLLDFVDKILSDPYLYAYYALAQVKRVQVLMTKYGAKRALELN